MFKLKQDLCNLPPLPDFSSKELQDLERGKIIKRHEAYIDKDGHKAGKGVGYCIVDRPPQKVWDQILNFDRYPEFYPTIEKCKVYKVEGDDIYSEFILKLGVLIKIHYHIFHTFFPDQSRLIWKVDQSRKNDFKESTGSWTAWPWKNDRSLIGYSVTLEVGRSVPKFIEDFAAESGLIKVMESIQRRVNSDGKFKR